MGVYLMGVDRPPPDCRLRRSIGTFTGASDKVIFGDLPRDKWVHDETQAILE